MVFFSWSNHFNIILSVALDGVLLVDFLFHPTRHSLRLKELKDSKKFDDPTYYKFLSLKHKILYEKENTLRNLKTKIAKTSPKIKKLAEIDSFVREELDTSDDLMNDILKEIHEL